jgi:hypothetical protein
MIGGGGRTLTLTCDGLRIRVALSENKRFLSQLHLGEMQLMVGIQIWFSAFNYA